MQLFSGAPEKRIPVIHLGSKLLRHPRSLLPLGCANLCGPMSAAMLTWPGSVSAYQAAVQTDAGAQTQSIAFHLGEASDQLVRAN